MREDAMAILKVHTDGSPVLKKVAKRVREVDDSLLQLINDMKETMVQYNGIGLAANQVGVLKRVITVQFDQGPTPFINPRIVKWSKETETKDEGCLSFPNIYGKVERDLEVVVEALDLEMKKHKLTMRGLGARVFQHEIDHLNGITFNTRAIPDTLHEFIPEEYDDEDDDCDEECDEDQMSVRALEIED